MDENTYGDWLQDRQRTHEHYIRSWRRCNFRWPDYIHSMPPLRQEHILDKPRINEAGAILSAAAELKWWLEVDAIANPKAVFERLKSKVQVAARGSSEAKGDIEHEYRE